MGTSVKPLTEHVAHADDLPPLRAQTRPCCCPQILRDWLPPDHLAYDIADLVDTLDLAPFYAPYEGDGRRNCPYEPAMMVKILLYAYATGTFSSRTMARKLEEDVAFRVLAAGNFPRHRCLVRIPSSPLG